MCFLIPNLFNNNNVNTTKIKTNSVFTCNELRVQMCVLNSQRSCSKCKILGLPSPIATSTLHTSDRYH